MSVRGITLPTYDVTCDRPGCEASYRVATWSEYHGARCGAAEAGWQVRPAGGKGSRSAPDLCPEHRTDGGAR